MSSIALVTSTIASSRWALAVSASMPNPSVSTSGRVAHHHRVVQSDGVVVPLVDRLVRFAGGFVVQVSDLHRHRVRRYRGAEYGAHQLREVWTESQVPQPTRPIAAATDRVLDAVSGASLVGPQLARHRKQHISAFCRQDPKRRGHCHRCGAMSSSL